MPQGNRDAKPRAWTTNAILALVEPLIRRLIRRAINGAGIGGDEIDHDALLNFVPDEHIDWTNTTRNFSTSGAVATGSLTANGDVFVLNLNGIVVGHTSFVNFFSAFPEFQVLGTGAPDSSIALGRWDNSAGGPTLRFLKSRNTAIGSFTIVQNGDELGRIRFQADDGVDYITNAAAISAEVDGVPGVNDMPGRLRFSTTSSGASFVSERMRIDNAGNIGINQTNPTEKLDIIGNIAVSGTVDGRDVAADGVKLDAVDDDAMLSPVGLSMGNLTDITGAAGNITQLLYLGRTMRAITTATFLCRVTTGYSPGFGGGPWAEIGVFTGDVVANGNASLSRVGFINVTAIFSTVGIKAVTIVLSGVAIGDPLWLAWGNLINLGGTNYKLRGMLADDIQSGVIQSFSGQLSLASVPKATTLELATTVPAWARLKI